MTIESAVQKIPSRTFQNCSSLETVQIGENIIFSKNTLNLTSFSVPQLGYYAFQFAPVYHAYIGENFKFEGELSNLPYLQDIHFSTLKEIPSNAFIYNINLSLIEVNGTAILQGGVLNFAGSGVQTIGRDPFVKVSLLQVIVTNEIQNLDAEAFATCNSIVNLDIQLAFSSYFGISLNSKYNLVNYTLDSIPVIQNGILNLTGVSSVSEINSGAYKNTSIIEAYLSPSIATLGDSVFQACNRLQKVIIPNSVYKFPGYIFSDCISLQTLQIAGISTLSEGVLDLSSSDL